MDRLAHSITEGAWRIGVGRTSMYALIDSGEIPTVRIGRRRLVTEAALVEYLERLQIAA
jgi:excisionase family DNA binding protein